MVPAALNATTTKLQYVATNRGRNAEGYFDARRQAEMTYLQTIVSVPQNRSPGDPPLFADTPNPEKHFVVAQQSEIATQDLWISNIKQGLAAKPSAHRDVTIFVHGYFNTYPDSLFRLAQIQNDLDVKGALVNFSWPSAGKAFGYNYDLESILFARDDLESVLRAMPKTGAKKIQLVSHSKGALLIMETLRQIELITPGWSAQNLDGVILISPDMSVDAFLRAAHHIEALPQPFVIFTSTKDTVLRLSNRVNRSQNRLGQLETADALADLPVVLIDVSNFSSSTSNNHMTPAESPDLITLIREANQVNFLLEDGRPIPWIGTPLRVRTSDAAIAIEAAPSVSTP